MASRNVGRRLLAAIADSTPAFTTRPSTEADDVGGRLLSGVADSTAAFTPGWDASHYSASPGGPPVSGVIPAEEVRHRQPMRLALNQFADDFSQLPPQTRLAARAWFPAEKLEDVEGAARLAIQANDLVHTLTHQSALNFRHALEESHFSSTGSISRPGQAYTLISAIIDGFNSGNTGLVNDLVIDIATAFADWPMVQVTSIRYQDGDIKKRLSPLSSDALVESFIAAYQEDFGTQSGFVGSRRAFNLALANATATLRDALTDLVGANVAEMDLDGIPLKGVRWSSATRWPMAWIEQIRRDSVEIGVDLYEIQPRTGVLNEPVGAFV